MSLGTSTRALGRGQAPKRLITRAASRLVLCLGLAAGLAVVLPAGGVAAASTLVPAGHHGPGGGGFGGGFSHRVIVTGTVTSTGTTGFTITRGFGPITPVPLTSTSTTLTGTATDLTINVLTSTKFVAPGMTPPAGLSDVVVGDSVDVTGRRAGPGIVNADRVVIPPKVVIGTVGTVGTTDFTVTLRPRWAPVGTPTNLTGTASTLTGTATTLTGTAWTIDVSGSTTYHERGVASSSLSLDSLSTGNHVAVVGTQDGTLTLNGVDVLIQAASAPGGGDDVGGLGSVQGSHYIGELGHGGGHHGRHGSHGVDRAFG